MSWNKVSAYKKYFNLNFIIMIVVLNNRAFDLREVNATPEDMRVIQTIRELEDTAEEFRSMDESSSEAQMYDFFASETANILANRWLSNK
ncbi:hypothetical protein [Persicobacter psychrovividus]